MLRRMFVSFVVVLDIIGYLLVMLVISNGSTLDDVRYISEGDAVLIMVIATIGFVANIALGYVLLRGSLHSRRTESRMQAKTRSRITGE